MPSTFDAARARPEWCRRWCFAAAAAARARFVAARRLAGDGLWQASRAARAMGGGATNAKGFFQAAFCAGVSSPTKPLREPLRPWQGAANDIIFMHSTADGEGLSMAFPRQTGRMCISHTRRSSTRHRWSHPCWALSWA